MSPSAKLIIAPSLSILLAFQVSAASAELKVFVSGTDVGGNTMRKAISAGRVKCVRYVDKKDESDAVLEVKMQQIVVPLLNTQDNAYSATLTAPDGSVLMSETSVGLGLGRIAKSLSHYACMQGSTKK